MLKACILGLGGVFLAQIAMAEGLTGDPEAGRKLAGQCRTCHGIEGMAKMPIVPHIGGENPAYIEHQLTAFREGRRVHEMMSVVAASLSDQAIADLAAWYSSQTPVATLAPSQTAENAPETCTACHGADGIALIDDAPNLAGETVMYIDTQLKAFRTGKRQHDIMSGIAAEMSNDEIRAVAEWYSSVQFKVAPVQ
ncbi:Cytochrome c4 [Roseovarius sp. EC-HK134]|uniref:c-type cytochrome n=1 Tax=Roseovarius TaxID=74030 RepID=UPI00125354D3|nr:MULTISPECIES: c-type cytochrome [unclassified Roseovarius]VVT11410.1 Cytochrome c4 [Roseovarius sp. EC-HK134]VVT11549.1 Cytochrome c4 [Roseovarius sp. EC-SD190]|tara:strand:+ start:3846 stop:4430 length:585 start_codon:yes stop_codon:yes gene_type:complete